MSEKDKLIQKLLSHPKDFTYREAERLLNKFGYYADNKGKTSGSRVTYKGNKVSLDIHKPHGRNYLLNYQIKGIITFLELEGVIND